ncbi:MAG: phosphoribosyltransferase family protein, partial [Candidatus Saccharimonadales bacterium]
LQHGQNLNVSENTVVVPVPSTSVPAAEGLAQTLGVSLRHGIIKNPYSPRSFLEESQYLRQLALELKHSPLPEIFADKDVVLVDDSIVRLNTMPLLAQFAAQYAKSVTVLIASPPVQWPDFYGIDMPTQQDLAAANMTREAMRQKIGCDYLGFLPLSRLIAATQLPREKFNLACFTGEYPIGIGNRKDQLYAPVKWAEID